MYLILNKLVFILASFSEIAPVLGARPKALRLAQGLQQTELAARAGVSRYAGQELEGLGKGSLISLLRVVQALGRESDLQGLFKLTVNSIAQMKRAERADASARLANTRVSRRLRRSTEHEKGLRLLRGMGWTLADNGSQLLFEYSPEALAQQLELSPHRHTLQ
jgi:transcriptional regulator with XRE-family HTH domain